ncbi:hypothetical protein DFR49_3853 [Hephaestia caeni]|uniref:DUF6285 domain-containing protein n=1 Tax=Hephaestia caeni TaxID=645617 RepID=A0A397NQI9_9SPHN|nr:DUF6285 domain-containing protein [Hephaestia caeni]RIA37963.1 hypothetical protein DFR49_3853 [Hephaestia caeni]
MSSAITPDQLVEAVAVFLRERVLPTAEGDLAFDTRVAANALDLVCRAMRQPAAVEAAHCARLSALLGESGTRDHLDALLCDRIQSGVFDETCDALVEHLRAAAIDALRVDQPRYSALRRALEA